MRLSSKAWRRLGVVLVLLIAAFVVVRTWVVPAVIVRAIRAEYGGKVVIGDWWFGVHSAGVSGLKLYETPAGDSPPWFSADRISTDVSISRLLRGRPKPSRVEIDDPRIAFHLDAKGQPITKIPLVPSEGGGIKGGGSEKSEPLPDVVVKGGELTLAQEGRKPMTLKGVNARLDPVEGGSKLTLKTDDPTWGRVTVTGRLDPTFKNDTFEITSSPGFVADPEKLERIPFVPAEVWANIEPRGPIDARVRIELHGDSPKPVSVHTELTLKGAQARLRSLQVETTGTTGRVVIDDSMVKVQDLKGRAVDGSIQTSGTLDFSQKVPRFDLDLRLKDIDVTKAPPAWQLNELGATGKLSGRADLKIAMEPSGPNLKGTVGRAVIEDGSFEGTPVKSLSLGMRADGGDLQYAALPTGSVDKSRLDVPNDPSAPGMPKGADSDLADEVWKPLMSALPLIALASKDQGPIGWVAYAVVQAFAQRGSLSAGTRRFGLPKSISAQIELEDVDLAVILQKAKKYGIEIPIPVAGRLSIKAAATIPIGSLKDLKGYAFKGDATLRAASIDHVDFGVLMAHLEMANGLVDLTDFRGQLVEKPTGDASAPPPPTSVPSAEGPLPPGAFRGHLRAPISPRGPATAQIEGNLLPLAELSAPVLPHPSPLSGELTLKVDAGGDLSKLDDPKTWALDGHLDSHRIKYRDATLDEVATEVHVKAGRVTIPDFAAKLLGRPLKARGSLDLSPPYRYDGAVTVESWEIGQVLGFVPGLPRPSPASGTLDARGDASGTLQPFAIATKGGARILRARAESIDLGNVVFQWTTDKDSVAISGLEIFAFGGKATGEARIPITPGRRVEATATLKGVDTSRVSKLIPGKGLSMGGRADGRIKVSMPLDASVIDATASLSAPDLLIKQGNGGVIPVTSLKVTASTRAGTIDYEATAESLGGRIAFQGSAPIERDLSRGLAEAHLQAAGFRLADVWKGLGMAGGLSHLDGVGAINSNIRAKLAPFRLYGRGLFEFRDLRYGKSVSLGTLKGNASLTPTTWGVDHLRGELFGGPASGEAHSLTRENGSKVMEFDFRVDRASLAKMTAEVPTLAREIEGFGSLRVGGRVAEALNANAEVLVPHARIYGIPLVDLRFPAEVELNPVSGIGMVNARHWTARLAGGSVRGSAWLRLGEDRAFQSEVQLSNVDIESVSRLQASNKKPATGKISGKISLNGPNPDQIAKIRGRVDLDLDDASLVELPVFKELDRFLGAARGGGLFEDGDIHASIANRTLSVEELTLNGRLIQLHSTGTVTFDGGLNLVVLVNTNQIIPQSGLALVSIIPGLGQVLGRGEEAIIRVASFLENRLLKFRVTGTSNNPVVQLDPGVAVGEAAAGFFSTVLKVPIGGGRKAD